MKNRDRQRANRRMKQEYLAMRNSDYSCLFGTRGCKKTTLA